MTWHRGRTGPAAVRAAGLAAAFDRTFWWALGFAVAGALPALLIGRRATAFRRGEGRGDPVSRDSAASQGVTPRHPRPASRAQR